MYRPQWDVNYQMQYSLLAKINHPEVPVRSGIHFLVSLEVRAYIGVLVK